MARDEVRHLSSESLSIGEQSQDQNVDAHIDLQNNLEDISLPPMGLTLPSSGFHAACKEHSNSQTEVNISTSMITFERDDPSTIAMGDDGIANESPAQIVSNATAEDEGMQGNETHLYFCGPSHASCSVLVKASMNSPHLHSDASTALHLLT
jgi:hypothetical protein